MWPQIELMDIVRLVWRYLLFFALLIGGAVWLLGCSGRTLDAHAQPDLGERYRDVTHVDVPPAAGECVTEASCGEGATVCRNLSDLVRAACKPLADGTCPAAPAGAGDVCNDKCCVSLVCRPVGNTCVPTLIDKPAAPPPACGPCYPIGDGGAPVCPCACAPDGCLGAGFTCYNGDGGTIVTVEACGK